MTENIMNRAVCAKCKFCKYVKTKTVLHHGHIGEFSKCQMDADERWNPVTGRWYARPKYCMMKNEYGDCPDFKEKTNVKKNDRPTTEKTKTNKKSRCNGIRSMHRRTMRKLKRLWHPKEW